jgi:4-hydroxy-3-methylbut-2-enyl diphosphate reductase
MPKTPLRVITALRSEYLALTGQVGDARLERCGMGPARVAEWLPSLTTFNNGALVVAGVAGGLSHELRAGDVVVASEVRDVGGRTLLRAAAPLAAELRAIGLRVHVGPIVSTDHIVSGPEREKLRETGALAVDMESAALVREVAKRDVCVAVVRVIVDTAHMPLARFSTVAAGMRALQVLRRTGPAFEKWAETVGPRTVYLAGPRSFCAGVDRAIDIVERALRRYPRPVYVRRQIVHNAHVVADLERQGAVFVDELDEVPDDTTVVFSAHGVAPSVRAEAERRHLTVVDATCPLVTKVHTEAKRFLARGDTVVLIGHGDHDETEGTLGEGRIHLVSTPADAALLQVEDPDKVSFVTQTTLAVEESEQVVDALRQRFPLLQSPPTEDICYATTNRQLAVRAIAAECDVVIVVGSQNSSNSKRLVEVSERLGTPAYLVDDATEIRPEWIRAARKVGLTAGASAPPHLIDEVVGTLSALGHVEVIEREVAREDIRFTLPKEVAH